MGRGDGRVLTPRALNRALLARQMLLRREDVTITRTLERMGGLQAQYAPSMYIGLWSRIDNLPRADLTRALERRRVVQGTLQRSTIHLVSARDYWPFALAVRETRRRWWLSVVPVTEAQVQHAAARVRDHLATAGQMTRADVDRIAGKDCAPGVGLWLDLVRVPPSGTWERRRADIYGLADSWLGPPTITAAEATAHVVRRYLAAFGPAPPKDIATWAGLLVSTVTEVLDRLTLRRFRDEAGRELVDLPRAPLPDPDTPAPVRFLPTYDAVLLAHARRAAVLPEEYRPLVFHTRMPQSIGTFTVDGAVAGTWRYAAGRIDVSPFEPLRDDAGEQVGAEAARLAAFHS
jgi:hypothetical protein